MKAEPAGVAGTITALITAVIALIVAFGVPLSDEQTAAILGVVAVIAPIVATLIARTKVTPTGNVVALRRKDGHTVAGRAANQTTGAPVDIRDAA